MTDERKAIRQIIQIGSIEVEGFMLPDGSYRMSQTQAAGAIGEEEVYARNFLTAKGVKQLIGLSYTPETFEVEATDQARGQTRIQGWTLEMVYTYWVYRCSKGNKTAFTMVVALGTESLERRFDRAFDITRVEADYNQRLIMRTRELESALQQISDGLAFDDDVRMERDRFRMVLEEHGIDPYE